MLFSLVSFLALGLLSSARPGPSNSSPLDKRTTSGGSCNADNLLRNLRGQGHLSEALVFCSQYLELPVITVNTTVPHNTKTVTVAEACTATSTVTTTTPPPPVRKVKRCTTTPGGAHTISTPGFLTTTTVDPSALSSGCACLTIPLSTETSTITDFSSTGTESVCGTASSTTGASTTGASTTAATTHSAYPTTCILPSPTAVLPCDGDGPASFDVDDAYYRVELDFEVDVYGLKSDLIFVSANGLLWLDENAIGDFQFYYSDAGNALPLGSEDLPDVAVLPFWADLAINGGSVQGIWYQESVNNGDKTVTIEWIASGQGSTANDYHFAATLGEDGKVKFDFYQVKDDGSLGTVAVQHKSDNKKIVYSRNEADKVESGTSVTFDTASNSVTEN
ncbi:hypothetical protein TWF696_007444 [Orbilia brochopaga]|uniref:Uncharacterized protein n=1 Tax=Orbilia brochopaga TaxID=3140254 RepID=A0AAV9UKE5_9PEZI